MGSQHGGPPSQHGGTQCERVTKPIQQVPDDQGISRIYNSHSELSHPGPQPGAQRHPTLDHHGVDPAPDSRRNASRSLDTARG
jgi:hypothetical protein